MFLEKRSLQPRVEKHKQLYAGKLKDDPKWRVYKMSINDDLEDLITRLSQSETIDIEDVNCFFTPKLTKEELKLVELKDEAHLLSYSNFSQKFFRGGDPDVDPEEMKKSDSKDKK